MLFFVIERRNQEQGLGPGDYEPYKVRVFTVGLNPTLSAARKLNLPFSAWRGVLLIIQPLVVNSILFYFQLKVDRQMSHASRDKCPEHPWILI